MVEITIRMFLPFTTPQVCAKLFIVDFLVPLCAFQLQITQKCIFWALSWFFIGLFFPSPECNGQHRLSISNVDSTLASSSNAKTLFTGGYWILQMDKSQSCKPSKYWRNHHQRTFCRAVKLIAPNKLSDAFFLMSILTKFFLITVLTKLTSTHYFM